MPIDCEINTDQMDIHRTSSNHIISQLTNLPWDLIHEIFDYLSLGDIYYSFYHLNKSFKNFIDDKYPCLDLLSMSFKHFAFYCEYVINENCQKINFARLSNEKPFDHITRFFSMIDVYTNLKKLYLYLPNQNQLETLPSIVPNLEGLYIILKNAKFIDIKWLSFLKKLETCFIEPKIYGIEIDHTISSFSSFLSSLTITISSASDFYTLLSQLPADTVRYLNVSLYDNEFSYIKTFHSPISSAKNLIHFSFNMSLKPMKDPSSLYDIIRFVSNTLHYVQTSIIVCRFADGIFIDEEKFRNYLSFTYSVKNYKFFIEMNNLPMFNETAYSYPFWIDKGIQVNIYRAKDKQIKRVRIYTLPLVPKISNLPNDFDDFYQFDKSSSNVNRFLLNDADDSIYYFADDLTLTPNRIYFSSNISLLFHLPRLSSFTVNKENIYYLLDLFSKSRSFPNIRKLQLACLPISSTKISTLIFRTFPRLQSLSINEINEFEIFRNIFDELFIRLPNTYALLHLCLAGLYFDDICPEDLDDKRLKTNLEEIFIQSRRKMNSYDISFNRSNRSIDVWF